MISITTLYCTKSINKQSRKILLFLLVAISCTLLNAQTIKEKELLPLIVFLEQIEQNFPYKFTYADDTIEDIFIHKIPISDSLDTILSNIQLQTALVFTILGDNYISINKNNDKPVLICGFVKEIDSGIPLQDATIKGIKSATITDQDGYFEIEVINSSQPLTINFLGFKSLTILPNTLIGSECTSIFLIPREEALNEVLLRNYITEGISKTDNGSYQIEYSNFGILPGLIEADALQTIQALPGILSADETVSNINIRGGTHDQNLIIWDGIKMYQSGHFFGLISIFNPNSTEKATLIKNGTGVEYTDGVSGTILMNTSSKINNDFKASIGLNLINVDAFTDIPVSKNSSLQLSARKSINDFVKTPTYTQYFDRISQDSEIGSNNETDIGFDFYDVNARWNWNISQRDRIRVNFLGINNELIFTENDIIDNMTVSKQSSLIQSSIAGGLFYERNWSDRLITSLQIYETDYTLKSNNVDLRNDQRFLQKNIVSETGIKLNSYYSLKENITWLNGYQFIETGISNLNDIDSPIFRENRVRVLRNHSVFSQVNYKSNTYKNTFHVGVKYNYNDKFETHIIEPRISYNQKFLNYFNLEILGEFKHQNTSQIRNFQNDFLGIEKRRWFLANVDDIPVVKSKQLSLGLHYKRKGWLISGEGYYKEVDGITARSQGFLNQYEFETAIGEYSVTGMDLLINKRFYDISTWLSYSLANNQYKFPSFLDSQFPNNIDISHSVTFGASYAIKDFKVSTGINWHSGLPTTRPVFMNEIVDNQINHNLPNSNRLNPYLRLDLSATYQFNISKGVAGSTGISVWNVLDTNNTISNYYRVSPTNEPQEYINSSLGITPNATFRVLF